MSLTARNRVGNAMDKLKSGLAPFVYRHLARRYRVNSQYELEQFLGEPVHDTEGHIRNLDTAGLLRLMWKSWREVFQKTLGNSGRNLVGELREIRNRWAHQEPFTDNDVYRALDSAHRLLLAVSADEAAEVGKMKTQLLRTMYDDQAKEQQKDVDTSVKSPAAGRLTPWREVVSPHQDVATGRYQQAEFAADLLQVHMGEGSIEYRNPIEFFSRTYLTESLKHLLGGAIRRLTSGDGDPVVRIQTNFGGGKTHSMLALYHLFSDMPINRLPGMDTVVSNMGRIQLPSVNKAVLVGTKISPGSKSTKDGRPGIRTLWGELAWQLGHAKGGTSEARRAYELMRADDEHSTNPGDALRELLNRYSPALVLIDEWVAYARQLDDRDDLPAGRFETQFTFAQTLTESARLAKNCLVVISLPASDDPKMETEDIEVGGSQGQIALKRLGNVIGRVESSWRPASAEESFEIVRRRLFNPIGEDISAIRDKVAHAFRDYYRTNRQEFPAECTEIGYEERISATYPIHPEVLDRLYSDWSTLQNFQRTRGVLRLMATVIHRLWENNDQDPLILPAHIPLEDANVLSEFAHYLPGYWVPVIESEISGENSISHMLDGEVPNLGKYRACRRVARSIYLGSAPIPAAANRGIEARRIRLGCVIPGEPPTVFGDAIRRLAGKATYLYQDGSRYWYSTQPTVTKLAENLAADYSTDQIHEEIRVRLEKDLKDKGDFKRVHVSPSSGQDVNDDKSAGLVVLGPIHPYEKGLENTALNTAKTILEHRGDAPRMFRNTLAFLAPDGNSLQDLEDGVRKYMAWKSIVDDKEKHDLQLHQLKQAQTRQSDADNTVNTRIQETYQWILVPTQEDTNSDIKWQEMRVTTQGRLARRSSKKMTEGELLVDSFAGTRLRMEMDKVPLWSGDHVSIPQLIEYFGKYHYLPMLKDPSVLVDAIRKGLGMLSWERDTFAYAESYDEDAGRYRGLQGGYSGLITTSDTGLLVKAEAARRQMDAEAAPKPVNGPKPRPGTKPRPTGGPDIGGGSTKPVIQPKRKLRRYHGSATLDSTRAVKNVGEILDDVIAHITGLPDANVKLTLEIEADIPDGAPEHVVRIVKENSSTLNFDDSGFEDT